MDDFLLVVALLMAGLASVFSERVDKPVNPANPNAPVSIEYSLRQACEGETGIRAITPVQENTYKSTRTKFLVVVCQNGTVHRVDVPWN